MRPLRLFLTCVLLSAGCGGGEGADAPPFAPEVMGLAADEEVRLPGLQDEVHVVFDGFGVPHIYAQTEHDMFFMQGYQHAVQRWPQLELGRRTAGGTLSLLVGGADAGVIEDDKRLRILGVPAAGRAEWKAAQEAGGRGAETVLAYTAGINRFLDEWRSGQRSMPRGTELFLDPDRAADWTPEDSVILARYAAYLLQYDGRAEVEITDVWQRFEATFRADSDDEALAWEGLATY